jgi:hypothetical protein
MGSRKLVIEKEENKQKHHSVSDPIVWGEKEEKGQKKTKREK